MTDYLTLVEGLAIHRDQIERYGGAFGVRDYGLLEAALYRPQTGYYASLTEEAAKLWESLSENHPFIDGNKRTAFAAAYTFLAINGQELTADALLTFKFVAGLYETNEMAFERLAEWLRLHVKIRVPRDELENLAVKAGCGQSLRTGISGPTVVFHTCYPFS